MTSIEKLEAEVRNSLQMADLSGRVIWDECQFLSIGGGYSVEIVLRDASDIHAVHALIETVMSGFGEQHSFSIFQFTIRAKWEIESIGEPEVARTAEGNVAAATVIPVGLLSGNTPQLVHVVITTEAELGFARVLNTNPDFKRIATLVVSNALRRGGTSSWDPQSRSRLEVNSHLVGELSRQMRTAA